MPNWFATFALTVWPFVSIILYRLRPQIQATIWTVLGAQLLLPVYLNIKFPMIPQFDKESIPSLCILLGCIIFSRKPIKLFNRLGAASILSVLYVGGPLITSYYNNDVLVLQSRVLPSVGLYDGLSAAQNAFIVLIPFLIARRFLRTEPANKEILQALVGAGFLYSLPLLFEIRFSPQLHNWVYGYSPGQFTQSIRGGGYRPMVFMGHGLLAAFFAMMAVVAATVFWRTRVRVFTLPAVGVATYLGLILIFCKSLGSAVYAIVLVPLIRWTKPAFQARCALVIVCVALLYPILKTVNLFPNDLIVEISDSLSSDRSQSLQYRFDNENILLAHALERPWFGWGRYGRNRVYDADSGKDDSVTDGQWIIAIGQFGLVGFFAQFGLLSLGVFRAVSAIKLAKSMHEATFLSALSLVVAINILDLLPNASLVPWTWLMSGALLGRSEAIIAQAAQKFRPRRDPISLPYEQATPSDVMR
jgi:hypothetical protein